MRCADPTKTNKPLSLLRSEVWGNCRHPHCGGGSHALHFEVALFAGVHLTASNVTPESGGRHVVAWDVSPRNGAKNYSQPREGDTCSSTMSPLPGLLVAFRDPTWSLRSRLLHVALRAKIHPEMRSDETFALRSMSIRYLRSAEAREPLGRAQWRGTANVIPLKYYSKPKNPSSRYVNWGCR